MKLRISILFLLISISLLAEIKAIWVPVWDLTSSEKIDEVIKNCQRNGINNILAQVRYRGDAMYIPNKHNSEFSNNEKRCYLLKDDFDPLQYLIDHKGKIKIHAWITTFVITPHELNKLDENHIFFKNPDWVTTDFKQDKMSHNSYEGAFLDPGIPAVQEYTKNVIMDIVTNYNLDGIHLDYIRYPDSKFGLNKAARKKYKNDVKYEDADSWTKWKEEQINNFVKEIYEELKKRAPQTLLSAAVIANPSEARYKYSQNWFQWLENGYIDLVFPMAYTTSDAALAGLYQIYPEKYHQKIVPGLRSWSDDGTYRADKINSKIVLTKKYKFPGLAFYSYSGIIQNNYFKLLKF